MSGLLEGARAVSVLIDASEHDSFALALLVQLVMTLLRSGEVLGLPVRDSMPMQPCLSSKELR
jgi:hypothetical protein